MLAPPLPFSRNLGKTQNVSTLIKPELEVVDLKFDVSPERTSSPTKYKEIINSSFHKKSQASKEFFWGLGILTPKP